MRVCATAPRTSFRSASPSARASSPGRPCSGRPRRDLGRSTMPAEQKGSLYKTKTGSGVRYRDAEGRQCRQGGFKNDREALRWLDDKLDEIARERRGEVVQRYVEAPTLDALCDEYLDVHVAATGTIRALGDRLRYARRVFGSQRI